MSLILLVARALSDLLVRDKGIWRSGSRSLIIISPRILQSVQLNPPKISSVYTETGPWKVGHKVWQSRVKRRSFELWAGVCWGVRVPGFRKPTLTDLPPPPPPAPDRRLLATYVVQFKRMAKQIKSKRMWAVVKNEKLALVAVQFQKSIVGFLSVKNPLIAARICLIWSNPSLNIRVMRCI